MGRLLIIGASVLQLPAILKAKKLGHYVAVADFNDQAVGIPYADEYFNASTIDVDAICSVAKKFRPDGIMAIATDMPVRSLAAATRLMGLPGITYETAIKATDKGEMIRAFKERNVESPWYYTIADNDEFELIRAKLLYPCVFKPIDNSGSSGVILVENEQHVESAYSYSKKYSRHGEVIVEDYMSGREVSVEVMVIDGLPHILAITDKLTTGMPYFVEMGHSQPSQIQTDDLVKIRDLAARAVKAVGIDLGPAHVEIILTKDGPRMVELGARMGGDCITTHLVPLSTGIDMLKATMDVAFGEVPNIETQFEKGSAIRYFDVPSGIITSITGVEAAKKIQGIEDIVFSKGVGDQVTPIYNSLDRIGFVIAQGCDAKDAVDRCDKAIETINITVQ
ncbi:MAG: ATP-grasp domain-containing protein [Bacteroidota bacterium]|nr:ATP-grasp domain-containing protein [Bacteroidota bacterium]